MFQEPAGECVSHQVEVITSIPTATGVFFIEVLFVPPEASKQKRPIVKILRASDRKANEDFFPADMEETTVTHGRRVPVSFRCAIIIACKFQGQERSKRALACL